MNNIFQQDYTIYKIQCSSEANDMWRKCLSGQLEKKFYFDEL